MFLAMSLIFHHAEQVATTGSFVVDGRIAPIG
jgi:hypothetical protein